MIDTLKMARAIERAGLNREGAETFAEELRDQIDHKYVTREHFDSRLDWVKSQLDATYWKIMAGVATMIFAHFVAVWFYVGGKVDAVDTRLDAVDGRLGVLENRLGAVEGKLGALETSVAAIAVKLGAQ